MAEFGTGSFDTGKESHGIKFGPKAFYELEEKTGENFNKISQRMAEGDWGFRDLVHLLWAGRQYFDKDITIDESCEMIEEAMENRGLEKAAEGLANAIQSSMPTEGDDTNLTENQETES